MNVQQVRADLRVVLDDITPAGWKATTETDPDKVTTGTIKVGHATVIEPESYKTFRCDLPVTLWVNEADAKIGVEQLYALISPGGDSLWETLQGNVAVPDSDRVVKVSITDAGNVGRRDDGPTGFLAADVTVRVVRIGSEPAES